MNSKSFVLETMRKQGRAAALAVQEQSGTMTGTELNAQSEYIPLFTEARKVMNMMKRKAGQADGFVCRSSAGRVVRLIQNYDSDIYTQEPEELPAQYRFVWSKDPVKALPFISLSESYYMIGDCCTDNGNTYRSRIDHNTHRPTAYPDLWEVAV